METRESELRGSRSAQLVIQKERWLLKQTMKNDNIFIKVDFGFKNTFLSAGHSSTPFQGSVLSPLLVDFFINTLLRLLDSTGISDRVKGVLDWNH